MEGRESPEKLKLGEEVPEMLTVSAAIDHSLPKMFTVSWSHPPEEEAEGFKVYREDLEHDYAIIATVYDTSYVDTAITTGIRYYYTITAFRDTMESVMSNIVSGAWIVIDDSIASRNMIVYFDSFYSSADVLVIDVPLGSQYDYEWIVEEDYVKWINRFDANNDGMINLSDFSFFGSSYMTVSRDTIYVE